MLTLQNITYQHPDKEILFENLNFIVNKGDKIAIVGNNGSGKSTLLKLISGLLTPSAGNIRTEGSVYYLPQILEQFDTQSIARALGVQKKLSALREILEGIVTEENITVLDDNWDLEEKNKTSTGNMGLLDFTADESMNRLSGGQKTKVLIAGIEIHQPDIILMDEPTNHLDRQSREQLYEFIENTNKTLLVVSHDRTLY